MQQLGGKVDRWIAALAGRSHGVVTRAELLAAGVSAEQVRQRLQRGSLIRVHRSVYRVGHTAPSLEARYLAAVRACGPSSLLCGLAAAHLWRLLRGRRDGPRVPSPEVLATTTKRIPGVLTHRTAAINPRDATTRFRIPITTVPRTMVDIASSLPLSALTRACHEADVLYGITADHVEAVLARRPNAAGAATLRRIVHGGEPVTYRDVFEQPASMLADLRDLLAARPAG